MSIIGWVILGLIAGALAKALMPGRDGGGILVTTALGVVGALVGGFVSWVLMGSRPVDGFFDLSTWLAAIAGSVVVLWVYRALTHGGGRRHSGSMTH